VKFGEVVERAIDQSVAIPERLDSFLKKEKQSIKMSGLFEGLKKFLLG
jgi:threonine synthase